MGINIKLSENTKLRVSTFITEGNDNVRIRVQPFYMNKEEEWAPARGGVTIPFDKADALIRALEKAKSMEPESVTITK